MSGAPLTPPYYADLMGGREEGLGPAGEARWTAERFARAAVDSPGWVLDSRGEAPVRVWAEPGGTGASVIGFESGGMAGRVTMAPDPSGWVLVVAEVAGREVLRGYLDRPYEEYDLWPPGADFPEKRTEDAPGRAGKRCTWLVLDSGVWPALAPIANEAGFVMARERDE